MNDNWTSGVSEQVSKYKGHTPNIRFYKNEIPAKPNAEYIEELLLKWTGNYSLLEENHSYIQWLFPNRVPGVNMHSSVLTDEEAKMISSTEELKDRVKRAFEMMLDFYGMKLLRNNQFQLAENCGERLKELDQSGNHNYLRITRILLALKELGHSDLMLPWMKFVADLIYKENKLNNAKYSFDNFWMNTLDSKDKEQLSEYKNRLLLEHRPTKIATTNITPSATKKKNYSSAQSAGISHISVEEQVHSIPDRSEPDSNLDKFGFPPFEGVSDTTRVTGTPKYITAIPGSDNATNSLDNTPEAIPPPISDSPKYIAEIPASDNAANFLDITPEAIPPPISDSPKYIAEIPASDNAANFLDNTPEAIPPPITDSPKYIAEIPASDNAANFLDTTPEAIPPPISDTSKNTETFVMIDQESIATHSTSPVINSQIKTEDNIQVSDFANKNCSYLTCCMDIFTGLIL